MVEGEAEPMGSSPTPMAIHELTGNFDMNENDHTTHSLAVLSWTPISGR
jgi:hypothetical protein